MLPGKAAYEIPADREQFGQGCDCLPAFFCA